MNPLVFRPDTTLRFVLLIVFALCGSASLYASSWEAFNQPTEKAAETCIAGFIPSVANPSADATGVTWTA